MNSLNRVLATEYGVASYKNICTSLLEQLAGFEVYTTIYLDECMIVALKDLSLQTAHLVEHRRDELLSTEAWVHCHDQNKIQIAEHLIKHHVRSARVNGYTRLHASLMYLLDASVQVVASFLMHRHILSTIAGYLLYPLLRMHNHHVHIHRLLGKIGVGLGCRLLAEGRKQEAWNLFCFVANDVDRDNLSALVNLSAVIKSGLAISPAIKEIIEARLRNAQEQYTHERAKRVLASSGRVYVDEDMRRRYEELLKAAEPAPRAVRLVNAVKRAGKNKDATLRARDELRKAVDDGAVEIGSVSRILVSLDMALGDKQGAENDALDALRHNRQDGAANALMGALRGEAGDYASAERFLRRAVRGGNVPPTAYNDLAETLIRTGKPEEAVSFAQKAVVAQPANWCFSETLASAQISARQLDAAEKALATAMQCAEEAKVLPEARNTLDLTQARLWKVQGKVAELRPLVQSLKKRDNLRPDQQRVLAWLEKGF